MNSTDTSDHTTPASSTRDHNQPGTWQVGTSPFLRHVNMRTLALLMFIGFAILNTTHGKDAETKEPAAGINNTEVVTNGHHESTRFTDHAPPRRGDNNLNL